jgi:DNA-directed RNA polymerase specialized sigma24 family protein
VLVRTFFDGLSLAEVAIDSGLPLGTVKSRARLALERLRRVLRSPGEAS